MTPLDQSQLAQLESLSKKLGVGKGAVEASIVVIANTISDSVVEKTIEEKPKVYYEVAVGPLISTTRTRSIKLKNLKHADMLTIIEVLGGSILTGAEVITSPHPILIAAGLLIMISSFVRAMTIELSEREASVFWGIIQACDDNRNATFDQIALRTNEVRKEYGLISLSNDEIKQTLNILEKIECVSLVKSKEEETWHVREKWEIRDISRKPKPPREFKRPLWSF